jgi:predicted transcriptional regulator
MNFNELTKDEAEVLNILKSSRYALHTHEITKKTKHTDRTVYNRLRALYNLGLIDMRITKKRKSKYLWSYIKIKNV